MDPVCLAFNDYTHQRLSFENVVRASWANHRLLKEAEGMTRMIKLAALAACVVAVVMPPPESSGMNTSQAVVTAAQVNGTWKNSRNEFKVLALGKNRLKVQFYGTHEYRTAAGPGANTGELSGVATIEGTIATLKEPETPEGCTITMTFKAGKMEVSQDGECGFGAGVSAGGSYRRVSNKKPNFTEE